VTGVTRLYDAALNYYSSTLFFILLPFYAARAINKSEALQRFGVSLPFLFFAIVTPTQIITCQGYRIVLTAVERSHGMQPNFVRWQ
jgi:hypothetical protein